MTVLPDQAAREQAWQRFDCTISVTAGAGSGKTRVLVDRYLAWILAESWSRDPEHSTAKALSSILAITFTVKAAGEMEERIMHSLRQIAGDTADELSDIEQRHVDNLAKGIAEHWNLPRETVIERAGEALLQTHRFEVSTIDSFASTILRQWPIEAGIHPDFAVDAEQDQIKARVHRQFVDFTLRGLGGPKSASFGQLLMHYGQGTLESLIQAIVDSNFDGTLHPPPQTLTIAQKCRSLVAHLDPLTEVVGGNSRKKHVRVVEALQDAAQAIEAHGDYLAQDPVNALSSQGLQSFEQLKKDLKGFPPNSTYKRIEDVDAVSTLVNDVHSFVSEALIVDPHSIGLMLELYMPLVDNLRDQLRRDGWLSYGDLLRLTASLLTNNEHVAGAVAARYRQILVDEFQDTNPIQCQILKTIEAADSSCARLFVVGDPKQSIYSFRYADLNAYEKFAGSLQLTLQLTSSFRSQANLLTLLNTGFDELFVAQKGLQPAPQALEPTREGISDYDSLRVVRSDDPSGEKRSADEARTLEAHAIAGAIRDLDTALPDDSGQRWSRYAVLCRAQSKAAVYANALDDLGIPYIVSGDKTFYSRQEVVDVVNLLRTIVNPDNSIAWVGLLRSPIGALPDGLLINLSDAGFFSSDKLDAANQALANAEPWARDHLDRTRELVEVIRRLNNLLTRSELGRWYTQLMTDIPLIRFYAGQFRGEKQAANVARLINNFRAAALSDTTPLSAWLDDVVQDLEKELERSESALADDTTDAVRLMTIHASKGLQFDHVFLPYLDWKRNASVGGDKAVQSSEDGFVLRLGKRTTWGIAAVDAQTKKVNQAESIRLLYVACTRARDSLTIMGTPKTGLMPLAINSFGLLEGPGVFQGHVDELHQESTHLVAGRVPPSAQSLISQANRFWARRRTVREAMQPLIASPSLSHDTPIPMATGDREHALGLGNEVHELLEHWEPDAPLSEDASTEALALVETFANSDLAKRFISAKQRHREIQFLSPNGQYGTMVGTIDLLLETDEGWIVVDYKTNRVSSQSEAEAAARSYETQGRAYMKAVHLALGVAPVRFELWFLRGPYVVPMPYEGKQ